MVSFKNLRGIKSHTNFNSKWSIRNPSFLYKNPPSPPPPQKRFISFACECIFSPEPALACHDIFRWRSVAEQTFAFTCVLVPLLHTVIAFSWTRLVRLALLTAFCVVIHSMLDFFPRPRLEHPYFDLFLGDGYALLYVGTDTVY